MQVANLTAQQGRKHKQLDAPFLLSAVGISDCFPVPSSSSDINNLKSVTRSNGKAAGKHKGTCLLLGGVSFLPFWDREMVKDFPKEFQGPSHEHMEADVCAQNIFVTSTMPICYGEPCICTLSCRESHLDCSETAQPFKRPKALWDSHHSTAIGNVLHHLHPRSLQDKGPCEPTQWWGIWWIYLCTLTESLSRFLHPHFTALMFSANVIWRGEARAAPRSTQQRVTELGWE